jgi:hypothetical protein
MACAIDDKDRVPASATYFNQCSSTSRTVLVHLKTAALSIRRLVHEILKSRTNALRGCLACPLPAPTAAPCAPSQGRRYELQIGVLTWVSYFPTSQAVV